MILCSLLILCYCCTVQVDDKSKRHGGELVAEVLNVRNCMFEWYMCGVWGGYFCMCMGLFLHVYVWCVCVCVCVWERESMHVWKCVCVCVHVWGWRGWGYSIQWIWDHRIICVCTETWHQVHLHPVWWSHFSHLGGLWEDWHPGGGHKAWGKLAISLSPTHPSFFCLFLFCWCVNYIFQYFIVPCIKFR